MGGGKVKREMVRIGQKEAMRGGVSGEAAGFCTQFYLRRRSRRVGRGSKIIINLVSRGSEAKFFDEN